MSMSLLAYGGNAYAERRRIGEWAGMSANALDDNYGLQGLQLSFGFGRLGERSFLILRQQQNMALRAGGYPFTLLLDPGEDIWDSYGWNAAWLLASLFHGSDSPGAALLQEPERVTADSMAAMFDRVEPAGIEDLPAAPAEAALSTWVAASVASEPIVIPPGALGAQGRPTPGWMASLIAVLPRCFRSGSGWLVGAGAALGRALGARLVVDDRVADSVKSPPDSPERKYWSAWKTISAHEEFGSALAAWERIPSWSWQDSPRVVLDRVAFLVRAMAEPLAEKEYQWLLDPIHSAGPLMAEIHRAVLRTAVSGEESMPAERSRYVLTACLDKGEALPSATVSRLDAATVEAECRRRDIDPWKPPECLELAGAALREVMKFHLAKEQPSSVPTILLALLESETAGLDDDDLRALAKEGLKVVARDPGSLENWAALRTSEVMWPVLRGGLAELARRRATERGENWAIDHLVFAADPGGRLIPADKEHAADLGATLLEALEGKHSALLSRKELTSWIVELAQSPLRPRVVLNDKIKIATAVAASAPQWLPFLGLVDLWEGDAAELRRVPRQFLEKQRDFLKLEFEELVAARRNLEKAPYLAEIIELLGTNKLSKETVVLLDSLRPPMADRAAFDDWVKGLERLGRKKKALEERARQPRVGKAGRSRPAEPPPAYLGEAVQQYLSGRGPGQEGDKPAGNDETQQREEFRKLLRRWGATDQGAEMIRDALAARLEAEAADFAHRFVGDPDTLNALMTCLSDDLRQQAIACLAAHALSEFERWVDDEMAALCSAYRYDQIPRTKHRDYISALIAFLIANQTEPLARKFAKSQDLDPCEFVATLQGIGRDLRGEEEL